MAFALEKMRMGDGTPLSKGFSFVIPVYNNEETLETLIQEIRSCFHQDYEILFVDDASSDHSKVILERDSRVRVMTLPQNLGQNRAIYRGLSKVSFDRVVIMDADLQDSPKDVFKLLALLDQGCDAAFAVRVGQYESKGRMVSSMLFKRVLRKITPIPQGAGLFVALERRMIDLLLQWEPMSSYLVGAVGLLAKKIGSVPVLRSVRPSGRSAYSSWMRARIGLFAIRATWKLKRSLNLEKGGQ